MYEVLTHQWCSLLVAFQATNKDNKTNNDNTKMFNSKILSVAVYPIDVHSLKKKNPIQAQQLLGIRTLLADQTPLLFKIIIKSLILRITRENKLPITLILRITRENKLLPIILDDQYFFMLEKLISALVIEITSSYDINIVRYKRLNMALCYFIRDLIPIISPTQIYLLIQAYFGTLDNYYSNNKLTIIELKLQFLDIVSFFDHFFAYNLPYTLDAPLSLFSLNINNKVQGSRSRCVYVYVLVYMVMYVFVCVYFYVLVCIFIYVYIHAYICI